MSKLLNGHMGDMPILRGQFINGDIVRLMRDARTRKLILYRERFQKTV